MRTESRPTAPTAAISNVAASHRGDPVANIAAPASRPALQPESREAEAQRLLSLAENYERNKLYSQAKERAEKIVKDFGDTPSGARAREMLRRIQAAQK